MVRLRHADERVVAATHIERRDARDVRLVGEHEEVEHQLAMVLPLVGNAGRPFAGREGRVRVLLLRHLDAFFDVADRL